MSRAVRARNHGILRASGFAIRRVDCRLPSTTAHDGFNVLLLFFNAGGFRQLRHAPRYVRAHELLATRLDVLTISISLEMFEEALTAPCVDALTISTNLAVVARRSQIRSLVRSRSRQTLWLLTVRSTCKLSLSLSCGKCLECGF